MSISVAEAITPVTAETNPNQADKSWWTVGKVDV